MCIDNNMYVYNICSMVINQIPVICFQYKYMYQWYVERKYNKYLIWPIKSIRSTFHLQSEK